MSLAFDTSACVDRAVAVLRGGILARDICRRGGRGEVAALFDRSLYFRIGSEFICIGGPMIGNGPTTLIVAARIAELGLQRGQRAFVSSEGIAVGDLLFDLSNTATWRAPRWPSASATLPATCAKIAQRTAAASPADSLARAIFATDATPLARLARPRVAKFVGWAKRRRRVPTIDDRGGHGASRLSPPYGPLSRGMTRHEQMSDGVTDLVGLGPGLTPSGDDFLIGALAMLDALEKTNMHAALGRAVVAAAGRTSPLSASFLRAAAAGHIGENLHMMVAAIITREVDAAVAAAARIGHTSGWDALAGAVVTAQNAYGYRC